MRQGWDTRTGLSSSQGPAAGKPVQDGYRGSREAQPGKHTPKHTILQHSSILPHRSDHSTGLRAAPSSRIPAWDPGRLPHHRAAQFFASALFQPLLSPQAPSCPTRESNEQDKANEMHAGQVRIGSCCINSSIYLFIKFFINRTLQLQQRNSPKTLLSWFHDLKLAHCLEQRQPTSVGPALLRSHQLC